LTAAARCHPWRAASLGALLGVVVVGLAWACYSGALRPEHLGITFPTLAAGVALGLILDQVGVRVMWFIQDRPRLRNPIDRVINAVLALVNRVRGAHGK